jgi:toluene monooxygenase system protein E
MATRVRRQRTWSMFGDLGRLPSEYEIVTHGLNYTNRPGRVAALESNPTTPANMWYLTYRDHSPLKAEDWNGFRDPDEMTYRRYVTRQDDQETFVERILEEFESVDHDATLSPGWVAALATVFSPQRFLVHGFQMCHAYLGAFAPTSEIINASALAAADQLRRVTLVAYRTRQLAIAHPGDGFGTGDRENFESRPEWQAARKAIELALTAYDWGECLTAVNLVLRPTLDTVLLSGLGQLGKANGDELTWLLLANLAKDSDRMLRWSTALARYAIEQRPGNAEVIRRWVDRWAPRADEAAAGIARMLGELPEVPADAAELAGEAAAVRGNVLDDAGVLEAELG